MGKVVRFPQERIDYFTTTDYSGHAVILILPLVRVDRPAEPPLDLCEETFAAMRKAFAELHEVLGNQRH